MPYLSYHGQSSPETLPDSPQRPELYAVAVKVSFPTWTIEKLSAQLGDSRSQALRDMRGLIVAFEGTSSC